MRSAVAADNAASIGALSKQLQLQEGFQCNSSLFGRAKEQIVLEILSEDCESIQLLPSFLTALAELNSNIYTEFHRDTDGRFEKAILVLDSQLFQNGQQVFGVDAAHMKHRNYNSVQLVFVARDGNMENKISAVALVPLENAENYKWFFGILLARGFPISSIPVFNGRHVGIAATASALNVRVHFCIRHIIGNLRADKTIQLQVSHEAFVWGAQAARTQAQYDFNLCQLEVVNFGAALYLKALEPSQWALYPHYTTTPLYGWRTTNFVESDQARSLRLQSRKLLPYEFFRAYSNILMGECYKRIARSQKWEESDHILTSRAHAKLQQELKDIPKYAVSFSSADVCYISHRSSTLETNLEVDLSTPSCPCATWTQFAMPCRHMLAAMQAADKMDGVMGLFSKCSMTAAYKEHLGSIRLPSDDGLVRDEKLLPSLLIAQTGRPMKRRFRSKGESRVRGVYQCRQCGKRDGHNKATCRHK